MPCHYTTAPMQLYPFDEAVGTSEDTGRNWTQIAAEKTGHYTITDGVHATKRLYLKYVYVYSIYAHACMQSSGSTIIPGVLQWAWRSDTSPSVWPRTSPVRSAPGVWTASLQSPEDRWGDGGLGMRHLRRWHASFSSSVAASVGRLNLKVYVGTCMYKNLCKYTQKHV